MEITVPLIHGRHELIRVNVTNNTGQVYKFENKEILNGKGIKGISLHVSDQVSKDENQVNNGMTPTLILESFLTLKTAAGAEEYNKIPAYFLDAGRRAPDKIFPIKNQIIDWPNSYFSITPGQINTNTVILLSVWFDDKC